MRHLLALALSLTIPAAAGGQQNPLPDFEAAQTAVERGEILPLAQILRQLDSEHPGTVVEVELEHEDGIRVYEVELITPDGLLIEVDIDAATGEILKIEEEYDD
ncbi:Peptidase propeptide and YPEB domain protein [Paracoccus haematequi]|uniref:Peptidase propeptide and YPEB domain protein n=1 Tax=Paracoccus haematequi TaxID=2491866 RepID=A0A447IQS7_9RHOB|nr:PepSY domain-containing protein [Paracoccus haematequi]VDS09883.1 Peptidase propeptide and YPEB domain protein [Paracoccus haematequi]